MANGRSDLRLRGRTSSGQEEAVIVADRTPPRLRPDHPEDFGRGPWWRLAELLVLGLDLRSPPPLTPWLDDEEQVAA